MSSTRDAKRPKTAMFFPGRCLDGVPFVSSAKKMQARASSESACAPRGSQPSLAP
jgi:hypothetical protein